MNYADATRLIYKLREVTVEHGATPGEEKAAQHKIKKLEAKYGPVVDVSDQVPPQPTRIWEAHTGKASWENYVNPTPVFFNPVTGEHSDNVIVREWKDSHHWHITLPVSILAGSFYETEEGKQQLRERGLLDDKSSTAKQPKEVKMGRSE